MIVVDGAGNAPQELRSDQARKLRILCLHGVNSSGKIMAWQVEKASWAPIVDDIAELVYMDAPLPTRKRFSTKYPAPYFEWFQFSRDNTEAYNLETSMSLFSEYITLNGPFDGLLGYSQGGILAPVLMGLYERGVGFKVLSSIQFIIVVGGALMPVKAFQAAFTETIKCPSVHFIGDKDPVKSLSDALAAGCQEPVVIRHPYGHLIPRLTASQGQVFRDFLLKQLAAKFPSQKGNDSIKFTSLL